MRRSDVRALGRQSVKLDSPPAPQLLEELYRSARTGCGSGTQILVTIHVPIITGKDG